MKKIIALLMLGAMLITPASAKYESYIDVARKDGVVAGNESGGFDEDKLASRAEFAVMLTKFLNLSGGINVFSDVHENDWFAKALCAANHHGLLMGNEYGMAMPYAPITREDAVTVLGRQYNARTEKGGVNGVSEYARAYWAYAEKNRLLSGENPKEQISKGEILKLIYDYDECVAETVRFSPGYPKVSKTGFFNKITLDLKTNIPANVYYKICETGGVLDGGEEWLCRTGAKKEISVSFAANLNKTYTVYLRAVADNGAEKDVSIENVSPFAIAIGSGNEADPYMIYTQLQLEQISKNPDGHFRLGGNISLDEKYKPVENFSGTLDGNGYKITISPRESSCEGVFGTILGGTVKNLTVDGDIRTNKYGGIIAKINEGVISECVVTGSVQVKTDSAGGICGQNKGTVKNCLTAAYSVAAGSFAGGICGQNMGVLENCLSAAEVVASEMYAGGISGTNDGGAIRNCVGANMTVYDSLTVNSGKLTTSRKDSVLENNYSYDGMISNAAYEEPSAHSQNGFEVSWDNICNAEFYRGLGWDMSVWTAKQGGYKLISPRKTAEIELIPGKTMYFPKGISNEQELRDIDQNSAGHYILTRDITLTIPWKTICGSGFSGTLDGNGYAIYNLTLRGESGMFSNITGGTLKNITLRNVNAAPTSAGAILTACNYGYIENCRIYGKLEAKKTGHTGTITGENHGAIINCEVYADITNTNANATIGGICAENDGNIVGCVYRGKITLKSENAIAGGICGYDTGGNIFECFAEPTMIFDGKSGYLGGICGIMTGTQGYKCASGGKITSLGEKNMYAGGICALSEGSVIYNALSATDVRTNASDGYAGGICGYLSESNVQNAYSAGTIISSPDVISGGICGFAENGFVMQSVALNPVINAGAAVGAFAGKTELCALADNYYSEKMLINGKRNINNGEKALAKSMNVLKNIDFYTKPIASGGALGWEADVWQASGGSYAFPVLSNVTGQERLRMPSYK